MRRTTVKPCDTRRYLLSDTGSGENIAADVVIVGCGIAGIYAALHIDPKKKILMINKGEIKSGSSYYAQGGIAAVMRSPDNSDLHIGDTLNAGAGLCDIEAVKILVGEGPQNIRELVDMGVPFDVNAEGELQITREGGHRERRIVHCGGDATGRETTIKLYQIACERPNISFIFGTSLVDVTLDANGAVSGVIVMDDEKTYTIASPDVILATGGIGQVYNYTTNPKGSVGDGITAAYRAGATIESMEMVQFHPTTLIPHYESDRLFLISEAVRGEGGILRNHMGEAFMADAHPMKDLAPRDIVTRAIYRELLRTGDTCVFIDASAMTAEFFASRFPTIFAECEKFGIKIPIDFIPVRPGQHYHMGGIKTDLRGATNIHGLYACGETASTGIHGANRLASNSMLECLVFGKRAAEKINGSVAREIKPQGNDFGSSFDKTLDAHQIKGFTNEIKIIMSTYAGAVRKVAGLLFALERISRILDFLDKTGIKTREAVELFSMTQTAKMVVESALAQSENIGAHYVEA
ncbi:L-aspartate oxidase [Clostridia bacterium]|nr:L-aspartate oxidase [Clostridia bacterium]